MPQSCRCKHLQFPRWAMSCRILCWCRQMVTPQPRLAHLGERRTIGSLAELLGATAPSHTLCAPRSHFVMRGESLAEFSNHVPANQWEQGLPACCWSATSTRKTRYSRARIPRPWSGCLVRRNRTSHSSSTTARTRAWSRPDGRSATSGERSGGNVPRRSLGNGIAW